MDISMSLQHHGWLDILVTSSKGEVFEIPVSFLSDGIYEIASKVAILDSEFREVVITVQTEPGEYRFRVSKISKELCKFQLFEMNDNFSTDATEEGKLLVSEEIKTIRILRTVHRELTKIKDFGLEEHKSRWGSDFPIEPYNRISEAIKNIKK